MGIQNWLLSSLHVHYLKEHPEFQKPGPMFLAVPTVKNIVLFGTCVLRELLFTSKIPQARPECAYLYPDALWAVKKR
jgi:hypothetical protein